jgi:hypothetical protein
MIYKSWLESFIETLLQFYHALPLYLTVKACLCVILTKQTQVKGVVQEGHTSITVKR